MHIPLPDKLGVADVYVVWVERLRIRAVQPVIQYPRNVVPVRNSEDQCFLWIEVLGHKGDSRSPTALLESNYGKRAQ